MRKYAVVKSETCGFPKKTAGGQGNVIQYFKNGGSLLFPYVRCPSSQEVRT